jgi:hypothetical protein
MKILPNNPDGNPPCPVCGTPAYRADIRNNDGFTTGTYLDAEGHLWITKWLTVAA